MKQQIYLILSLTLLLASCAQSPTGNLIAEQDLVIEKHEEVGSQITESSTLNDFLGTPSVIVFGGTYCGHCQAAVPVFKEQVYDVYKKRADIWVNVIDDKQFPVDLPQGLNRNLDFDTIVGKQCGYVPSWVVLDAENNVLLSSCGNEHSMAEMLRALNEALN
jgi:thiol-disulfide isomerase/thioredoxin